MLAFQAHGGQKQRHQDNNESHDRKNLSNFTKKNTFQRPSSKNFQKPNDSSRSNIPPSTSLSIQSSTSLSNDELSQDGLIGGFDFQPSTFQRRPHASRDLPKFLIYQSPTLNAGPIVQDDWDKANQDKMAQMESSASDPSTLFEEFQRMRDDERQNMEKKGLVDKEGTRKTLDDAISFKGSCLQMCPVYERIRRSVENDVRKYEKDPSGRISKDHAIKAFSRPAAGQPPPLPSDVRPPQVLVCTLDYLIDNVLQELPEAQSFIWDRTRSIRQDFTYQNYSGPEAVECHEKIVRIHILTLHVMAKTAFEFSRQQELEQMNKALKTLSEMYTEYRSRGIKARNEAEFRAYYLLSQLRDPELDREIQKLPVDILQDDRVQLALNLRNVVQTNVVERGFQFTENVLNLFKSFFHNFKLGSVPLLMSYMLEVHLNEIRFYSFKAIRKSLHNRARPYPIEFYIDLLAFNDEADLEEFCSYYGIQIALINDIKHVDILSLAHNSHLIPDKRPFRQSFSVKHDSKISSYKDLVNSGLSNLSSTSFPQDLTLPTIAFQQPSTIATQPVMNFGVSSTAPTSTLTSSLAAFSGATSGVPSSSLSSPVFAFSFPKSKENIPKLQEIKSDEEKRQQEREDKEMEMKRAVAEEEVRRKEQEQKRFEEMNRKLILKQQQKRQKKLEMIRSLSSSLVSQLISSVVQEQTQVILAPIITEKIKQRELKEKVLNSFSQGLYEAFISELVYFESMDVVSSNFRIKKLKEGLVRKVCQLCKDSKKKLDMKKRKRDELRDASRNFGIPTVIKRKKLNVSTTSNDHPRPVDLNPLDFETLLDNLTQHPFDKYEMLIFSQEFKSTTSKFLRRKFAIGDNMTHKMQRGKVELHIIGTEEINPKFFEGVNILVFNCDGIERIREQKFLLCELVQGICLNTNFRFEILIIYWEFEGIIKFSEQDILQELNIPKSDCIESITIVKLDPRLNCDSIQRCLDKMGSQVRLSAKGEYNQKYLKPMKPDIQLETIKPKEAKEFVIHEDSIERKSIPRHLVRHIESSPKVKPMPKLLSDGVKQPSKTFMKPPKTQSNSVIPSSSNFDSLLKPMKKSKLKIDVYSTPRPKSSELLQTPSFYGNSSTISNLSNITFANHSSSSPLIINKPTYAQVAKKGMKSSTSGSSGSRDSNDSKDGTKEEGIPKSILELRKLVASVKQKHSHK
jgi:hypothetical protein